MLPLDDLRAALGFGPTEGEAWFDLSEEIAKFAPQKTTNRAVILYKWGTGPIATLFARTGSRPQPLVNPAHTHQVEFPECWLRKQGWIVTARPLPIDKAHLTDDTRMCTEDDAATIAALTGT